MKKDNIYKFNSYVAYLNAEIEGNRRRRGLKSAFAKAAGCKPSFISQVLGGKVQLTPDHAHGIAKHLELNPDETEYFLNLVHQDRAASQSLKGYYADQVRKARARFAEEAKRGHTSMTKSEFEKVYYSSWIYSAIHVSTSIPALQTVGAICSRLNLSRATVEKVLRELCEYGLVEEADSKYRMGNEDISLDPSSAFLLHHRANWRMKSLEKQAGEESLHFTGIFSLSRRDIVAIRELMLDALVRARQIVRPSKEEELAAVMIDVFSV